MAQALSGGLSPQDAELYERDMKDDLILLEEAQLTHGGLSKELSARYKRDEMYTAIGEVLIAVNPYRVLERGGKSMGPPRRQPPRRGGGPWSAPRGPTRRPRAARRRPTPRRRAGRSR